MATKNFDKMATKKLNALLETASEEDRVAIQAVLDARAQNKEPETQKVGASTVVEMPAEAELSPEEQAAIDAAEAEAQAKAEGKAKATKKELSEEEIASIIEDCKKNVGHKASVLPYGEVDWVDAVIVGVTHDKRSNAIMYRIKEVESGKLSHKAYDAKILRISEEIAEVQPKTRTSIAGASNGPKRTTEEALELKAKAHENKGRLVEVKISETETKKGTIIGVMHDPRSNAVMYSIQYEDGTKNYKVVNSPAVIMLDEWNADIKARADKAREAEAARLNLTPQDKVNTCEVAYRKALEAFEAAKARLEAREADLKKAQEELAKATEAPAETSSEEQPAEGSEDLTA